MSKPNLFLQRAQLGQAQREANVAQANMASEMAKVEGLGRMLAAMTGGYYKELKAQELPDELIRDLMLDYQRSNNGMVAQLIAKLVGA